MTVTGTVSAAVMRKLVAAAAEGKSTEIAQKSMTARLAAGATTVLAQAVRNPSSQENPLPAEEVTAAMRTDEGNDENVTMVWGLVTRAKAV